MSRIILLKKHLKASVDQGLGEWMGESADVGLGEAVFSWTSPPSVKIFEDGFSYGVRDVLKIRYEDLVDIDLLDLHSLMMAQKQPSQDVEFLVKTKDGDYLLRVPLFLYTTLASILPAVMRKNGKLSSE